ncbi:MAG: DUF4865 family protein [Rhizobiaceae bacterium]|nr:DUF4865 family protein [Rhizobiaceae bacterium]
MIAMQYSFTLPADYDMGIIERRIRDKGPLLDNLPGLRFKAYLSARKGAATTRSRENFYAPFYVWNSEDGLSDFLCGPNFLILTDAFGRPEIHSWITWNVREAADISSARFATRETIAIAPDASLADIKLRDTEAVASDVERDGALASVAGFEPRHWTRVRFRLWGDLPSERQREGADVYDVGHLSLPGI